MDTWKDIQTMPQDIVVETIGLAGDINKLIRKGNLLWLPDMSMYVYYVPKGWRWAV